MAFLVVLDPAVPLGKETLEDLDGISWHLARLKRREPLRAALMNIPDTGLQEFAEAFGVVNENAQALSDRLSAINGGVYTGLMDTVSEVIAAPPV